jgi:predicted negative regulator of RcsB-dependent stress response
LGQHISRKELKTDEVRETFAHGAEAVLSHQRLTIYLLAAAIVLALGIFGWKTYSERQTVKASAALNDGMKVFMARVRSPGEPADPGEVTYVDEKNKFTDASQKFGSIALKYPRTRPGQIAAYYAALSLEKVGKDEDARKWLQGLAESNSEGLAAKARFELAQLDDLAGRSDEAEKIYQQLMAKPAPLVPKPVVMMALAEHYATKNPAEAAKLFTQIKTDYPDTPMAEQADQELALLPGKI